jgi:hypothetical protein
MCYVDVNTPSQTSDIDEARDIAMAHVSEQAHRRKREPLLPSEERQRLNTHGRVARLEEPIYNSHRQKIWYCARCQYSSLNSDNIASHLRKRHRIRLDSDIALEAAIEVAFNRQKEVLSEEYQAI